MARPRFHWETTDRRFGVPINKMDLSDRGLIPKPTGEDIWRVPHNVFYAGYNDLHFARGFLQNTNDFENSQLVFPAQSSYTNPAVLPANGTHVQGAMHVPGLIIPTGDGGVAIGNLNPFYVPPTSPIHDLSQIPVNSHTTRVSNSAMSNHELSIPDEVKTFTARAEDPYNYHLMPKYFGNPAADKKLQDEISPYVAVITPKGLKSPNHWKNFWFSPEILIDQIQQSAIEKLGRGFIDPHRRIDAEFVKELHRNASEYFRTLERAKSDPQAIHNALVSSNPGNQLQPSIQLPKKPIIYYIPRIGEGGKEWLIAKVGYPEEMIQESREIRGGTFKVEMLGVIPIGRTLSDIIQMSVDHPEAQMRWIEFKKDNPNTDEFLIGQKARLLAIDQSKELTAAHTTANRAMIASLQPQVQSQGNVSFVGSSAIKKMFVLSGGHLNVEGNIRAEDAILVAQQSLRIYGSNIQAKNAFIASLLGDTLIESKKVRVYYDNNGSFYDQISKPARIYVDNILKIFSGRDLKFIGAETHSGVESDFEALANIWDIPVQELYKNIVHYEDKKKKSKEIIEGVTQRPSYHSSSGVIKMKAGGAIIGVGHQVQASKKIVLQGKYGIKPEEAHNAVSYEQHESGTKGKWLTKRKFNHSSSEFDSHAVSPQYTAPWVEMESEEGDLELSAARIFGNAKFTAPEGILRLNAAKNSYERQSFSSRSDLAWRAFKNSRSVHETFTPTYISGPEVHVDTKKGVVIQRVQGQTPDFVNRMNLKRGGITYEDLTETHVETSKKIQGPTKEAAALAAIAVAALTYGQGTALAGFLGAAEEGIAEAMIAAAYSSACTQLTGSALSSQGRSGDFLKSFCSKNTLKSIATSAATAGATHKLGNLFGVEMKKPEGLLGHGKRALLQETTSSAMHITADMAFNHEKLKTAMNRTLQTGIANTVVNTFGGYAANKIGAAYSSAADGSAPRINCLTHKGLHAAVGAGVEVGRAAMSGKNKKDMLRNAIAGGTGAFAAEAFAEWLTGSPEEIAKRIQNQAKEKGIRLTKESFAKAFQQDRQSAANWAKFNAGLVNFVAGQNVDVGNAAATNALENNFLTEEVKLEHPTRDRIESSNDQKTPLLPNADAIMQVDENILNSCYVSKKSDKPDPSGFFGWVNVRARKNDEKVCVKLPEKVAVKRGTISNRECEILEILNKGHCYKEGRSNVAVMNDYGERFNYRTFDTIQDISDSLKLSISEAKGRIREKLKEEYIKLIQVGVSHGDIHPGNILVKKFPAQRDFMINLIDFGFARIIEGVKSPAIKNNVWFGPLLSTEERKEINSGRFGNVWDNQRLDVHDMCIVMSYVKEQGKSERQMSEVCVAKINKFQQKHPELKGDTELNEEQKADLIELVRDF